ncbi:MAG: hypothetical protein V1822_03185 [Candidatus Micrarchaeota archaeon]
MLIATFSTLVRITQVYTPIGIEVEEPLDAKIDVGELQQVLMEISTTNQELTNHILTKTMSPEQKAKFERHMAVKAQFGKKIRDRMGGGEKEENTGKKEEGVQE